MNTGEVETPSDQTQHVTHQTTNPGQQVEGSSTPTITPGAPTKSKSAFAPLRHRNYSLVFFSALVSNLGTWMQTVALGALVVEMTGQARWAGIVAAAGFLPMGLLGPVGGALADYFNRRRFAAGIAIFQAICASLLAVLVFSGKATPLNLTLVVFFGDGAGGLGFPAYQALLPSLVPKEDLPEAISLSSAQWNLGRVLGPAAAGLAIKFGGYELAFVLNAVSFAAMVAAMLMLKVNDNAARHEPLQIVDKLKEGIRATRDEPGCRAAVQIISLTALLISPFIALIPAVAENLFNGGESLTAALVACQGVGAVIGALSQSRLYHRFGRARLLKASFFATPVAMILYGLAPNPTAACVAMTLVGACYIFVFAGSNTLVQLRAPEALRARVLSIYLLALGVLYPIAAVIHGDLADRYGLREVTIGTAAIYLAIVSFAVKRDLTPLRNLGDPQ